MKSVQIEDKKKPLTFASGFHREFGFCILDFGFCILDF